MIDIHAHIVNKNHEEVKKLIKDMDQYNISKRVVSTLSEGETIDNIKFIEETVSNYPDKLIGCAVINPKELSALDDLNYALKSEFIKMIEFNPVEHAYFPDLTEKLDNLISLINEREIPIKIYTGIGCFGIPQQWEDFIIKYLNTKFVFLHMGCFDYGYTCIDVVSRHDNAYVEISNQYELQILRKAINKINIKNILFGTTYPERLTSSALKLFDTFTLSEEEIRNIYIINNKKFFGEVV